ncbi:MAG: DUF805 domain-containing protein [Planctomycetaceae bacterium]|jgi:uncharacterized membrane protein YhaH (DUF805 family)/predicted RNA-binding Zn-ribbon protein involved in translation (DUF1610 family)|nr:DUF805 domain-containing protein [Planctomycetaceae bacterium]
MNFDSENPTCPACGISVEADEVKIVCPSCKETFHEDCWQENKGCSTYLCDQVNILKRQRTNVPPYFDQTHLPDEPKNGNKYFDANTLGIRWRDIMTKKYCLIKGRARRKELWMFFCVNFLLIIIPMLIGGCFIAAGEEMTEVSGLFVLVGLFFSLVTFLPTICLFGRRLHDIGCSAWPALLMFVPPLSGLLALMGGLFVLIDGLFTLASGLFMLIISLIGSQEGDNQYGPNPIPEQENYFDANMLGIRWRDIMTQKYRLEKGRARRKEFWMFNLINFLISSFLFITALILMTTGAALDNASGGEGIWRLVIVTGGLCMFAYIIFLCLILLPSINIMARRLHDLGLSSLFILLILIPCGAVILFLLCCLDSQSGNNQYGPNPKGID